jgi:hypothetical protein
MKRVMKVASIVMAVVALTAASTTQVQARGGFARELMGLLAALLDKDNMAIVLV